MRLRPAENPGGPVRAVESGIVSREGRVCSSALYPGDDSKRDRHERYKLALENVGVVTQFGHYIHEDTECRGCGREWKKPTEKETDIAVALALMLDAQDDVFDVAYAVSADSDQAATARAFQQRFGATQAADLCLPSWPQQADQGDSGTASAARPRVSK